MSCAIYGTDLPPKIIRCLSEIQIELGALYFVWQPRFDISDTVTHYQVAGSFSGEPGDSLAGASPALAMIQFSAALSLSASSQDLVTAT